MKKILFIVAAGLLLASCGSIKKVSSAPSGSGMPTESLGVSEIQMSAEQKFAQDPNKGDNFRAWAQYNGFEDDNLEAFAAARARAAMAEEIKTRVQRAIKTYSDKAKLSDTSVNKETTGVKTGEGADSEMITTVAKELVRDSRIVMSHRYRQKDGTVTCYVAVERPFDSVLNDIRNNNKFKESINMSRRAQIDFNSQAFQESMKADFADLEVMSNQ